MPNSTAVTGDVYQVYRNVTTAPYKFGQKRKRPCVCADPCSPMSTTWTALPRLTHGIKEEDVQSGPLPSLGLDRPGAWSRRFVHHVLKEKTGGDACEYRGPLPGDVLTGLRNAFPRYFVD